MRLSVSSVLLLLLALTQAEDACSNSDKLRTITDRNEVVGRFHFMAAYSDNDVTNSLLKLTNSFWGEMFLTEDGLFVEEYSKMNGTCREFRANISVHGEIAKSSLGHVSSEMKLHNFTKTLFIMELNTTMTNASEVLQSLHLDPSLTHGQETIISHCYYLISRERELSDGELQLFKEQAKCAGFTGEPAFVYKSDQGYCTELESTLVNPKPECSNLKKLDTITDKTQVVGPFYFMAAYTDNEVFKNLIKLSTSIKVEIALSEDGFYVEEFTKLNGTCVAIHFNVTHNGGINKAIMPGTTSEFKFRSFGSTSRIMDVRLSSDDIMPVLQKMHIDPSVAKGQSKIKGRGYYLISNDPKVNDADMELFRKYAKCALFPEEPALLNKGNNDYCSKEGSFRVL